MAEGDVEAAPAEEVAAEAEAAEDTSRQVKQFWFLIGGQKFAYLDLTGKEALALEERFPGYEWGNVRPSILAHRLALLETFLSRSDPDNAVERVGAMTIKELDDAIEIEYESDLPTRFVDGLPKAADAP